MIFSFDCELGFPPFFSFFFIFFLFSKQWSNTFSLPCSLCRAKEGGHSCCAA